MQETDNIDQANKTLDSQGNVSSQGKLLLAPAVTVGETEGAMDSTSVFFASSFAYNFVRK